MSETSTLTMFGTPTCSDCTRSRALLDSLDVAYDYVDISVDAEAADRALAVSGRTNVPVIVFPDGTHTVEPTDDELRARLSKLHLN